MNVGQYWRKSWNVTAGCCHVSPGCLNCWAEKLVATRLKHNPHYRGTTEDGKWSGVVKLLSYKLSEPFHWKKPQIVFVNLMSDLFHPLVMSNFIIAVYREMAICSEHTFIVCTKRPERIVPVLYEGKRVDEGHHNPAMFANGESIPNVIHLASVESQIIADNRIQSLLRLQNRGNWRIGISAEPLLDEIDLNQISGADRLNWIIVGAETGKNARPAKPEWFWELLEFADAHDIPFYQKSVPEGTFEEPALIHEVPWEVE